ncbi:hypothetical protein [Oceanicoccus sp. KOV_DT_Chl]|uniref:hypothetical protein n=1 Tax=Oceanicoccus sp. KOV_DT_Chl TaxID=1904639 RepID=UPI000C7D0DCB|nr:hypothetical protein [Oceanicoccus sp. KOV_DT_Chl]
MLKADVYQGRYENFRKGLNIKSICIDESTKSELEGVTFAFVCVDNGDARSEIFDVLINLNIPFIDVGMGLKRDKDDGLSGMVRTTLFPEGLSDEVRNKSWATESEDPGNMYKSNIQIGELNALNACLAVFRFKQLRGFYCSNGEFLNTIFNIRSSNLVREGIEDES